MEPSKLISVPEAAEMLGLSRVYVWRKVKDGTIPSTRVGRNYVVDKNDLPTALQKTVPPQHIIAVERSVEITVKEYGEALRLLARE